MSNCVNILEIDRNLLSILLRDHTTDKNIIWATDMYEKYGDGYSFFDEITIEKITKEDECIIKPRVAKSKEEQTKRIKEKAEVFTPSWLCNKMLNLVDETIFGYKDVFNVEIGEKDYEPTTNKIVFPCKEKERWEDYIYKKNNQLEITCGEAPFIVSRYDAVTGEDIPIKRRIGMLDRKLRIVNENTTNKRDWILWATRAFKSVMGYEWQGDNILIARVNLLYTYIDYFKDRFNEEPTQERLKIIADIISWNIWQMDGLKFVLPNSCHTEEVRTQDLFGNETITKIECEGCKKDNPRKHNGIYAKVKDWDEGGKVINFVSVLKSAKNKK